MSLREVRLLLVDDDPSAIQVMSRMLHQYPGQRFATSGEVALRMARDATPDLIVLDMEMPGMSGLDVCAALKADPVLAAVPVIIATSHATPAIEAAALRAGAADFVSKPLIAAQLTVRVRAQLRARQLVEDLEREWLAVGAPPLPSAHQTPRLLIVDDDVASIQVLQHTMQDIGDIHFASSGAEALRLARSLDPHLILLDAHMPDLDGFEVCAALKSEPAFAHTPIVFVTRFSNPGNEMRALDLGAADFVAKPYTPAVLLARVRNLLDLARRAESESQAVREHWRRMGDARVAAIVAGASDAIVSYDADETILLANAAAGRMFGCACERMIGMAVRVFLGANLDLALPASGPVRITVQGGDQQHHPAEASASRVGQGRHAVTTVILRDVSDRERLQSESMARVAAETANRTKSSMLSYIAHEMGNPLNGLLGMAGLMQRDTLDPLSDKQAARLAHILTSSRSLAVLMRDVLDVGRLEAGKLLVDLQPVDCARCIAEALAAVADMAAQAGVLLVPPPALPSIDAIADGARLQQCLANLLTNAIKYNRPLGKVWVELRCGLEEVAIRVCDNGLGLDETQRAHLFEPFNRLGRQQSATPGAGLGLMITQQLALAMNGRLEFESEAGLGSCFSIVLASAASDAGSMPAPTGPASDAGGVEVAIGHADVAGVRADGPRPAHDEQFA